MQRSLCLVLSLLVFPLGAVAAEGPSDLSANAALKYWQAFAQLPKLTDAEAQRLNTEYLTMPLDGQARELVAKSDYALRMMHQGAALRDCAWAIGWEEEGIDALLPQMSAARVLSSLACLRARLRFEEKRNAEALSDIVAAFTVGRHVSVDGSLIGVLVGYSIEARVGDALALYLPRLDAGTVRDLRKRLDALPAGGSPATGLRDCEEKTMDWFIRKVRAAKDKEQLLALLSFLGVPEGKRQDPAGKARAFLEACGGTADGIIHFAEETRPSYARLAAKLPLPPDQFEKELDLEIKRHAGNPVFRAFFPAIEKARWMQARADIRWAMLSAAFAVQLEGRAALKDHPDPMVGGPFEYVPFEGGFELRSKFKHRQDKPVTLTVGRRGP